MKFRKLIYQILVFGALVAFSPQHAKAFPTGEGSLMGSYSKTNYGNNAFTTTKRYTIAAGVFITPVTEIEISFMYSDSFFNYDPVQTTSVNEQILSASVIQSIVPPSFIIQPYGKFGVAQYNRRQEGTISGVPTAPTESKSPSAIIGAGARIFLLRNFSLRVEGITYLPDLKFGDAKDNFSVQVGASINF